MNLYYNIDDRVILMQEHFTDQLIKRIEVKLEVNFPEPLYCEVSINTGNRFPVQHQWSEVIRPPQF